MLYRICDILFKLLCHNKYFNNKEKLFMTAILIGGEKGGTGKSTIATNIAVMASIMGSDVLLLDCDKQSSSAKFIDKRKERGLKPSPTCVQIRGKNLRQEISNLSEKYELVIIDAGGQDSPELRSAMACSAVSKLYIPLQASEFDLDTIAKMDELSYFAQSFNPNLVSYLIFNHAPTHSKITVLEEAYSFVKELEYIHVLEEKISHRVPFQYAASESMCVVEFELERIEAMPKYQADKYSPKASMEICALYKHIFGKEFESKINDYNKSSNLITA